MKNDAITFLHADLRVQITSLKRVIRRLLKQEGRSEGKKGTNPDVSGAYLGVRVPIYAYAYTYTWM